MSLIPCPICGKQFDPKIVSTLPFCCDRCRQIDLARWLGENYAFPSSRLREDEENPGPEDDE